MLSVVIPAYNEEKLVAKAARRVSEVLAEAGIDYELVFVDDGSKDGTWQTIKAISEANDNIIGIHFSRNFGKEAAMFAGLEKAGGDAVAVMDCDLQHPPEKLPEMYALWQEGYEVVEGLKRSRGSEGQGHKAAAGLFYKLMSKATGFDMSGASDFKLLDRKVVDSLNSLPEKNVFFRALSYWAGFKTATVYYAVKEREDGESKWSTRKLIRYAITNVVSFTSAPLSLITVLGVVTLIVSVVMTIVALVQKIIGVALGGFTTVIILLLFVGSIIMICLGIIGVYIAKIYDEVKGRPKYIISEMSGHNASGK